MPVSGAGEVAPPADLVELGAVRSAYGLKGWAHFIPYAGGSGALPGARHWWLGGPAGLRVVAPEGVRAHADALVVKWSGCESKEQADACRGATLSVSRSEFPATAAGEYYWADLLGCRVVNRAGSELGVVSGLRENAGGQWLEVLKAPGVASMLIPLVEPYVDEVDVPGRQVRVDWQEDW